MKRRPLGSVIERDVVQAFVEHMADVLETTPVSQGRREYIAAFMRAAIVRWDEKQREQAE